MFGRLNSSVLVATAALAVAGVLSPTAAMAQCDAGDAGIDPTLYGVLRDTFPADQGINVPTDGVVRLRYFGRIPDPPTICVRATRNGDCVDGEATALGDQVVWVARGSGTSDPLLPFTLYTVSFADSSGGANRITFTTAGSRSPGPPSFAGVSSVDSNPVANDLCDPHAVDVTVHFTRANNTSSLGSTSWPDSDLEYVIYQTRGPGISNPRERDRVRLQRSGSTGDTSAQRAFRLSGAEASGPVCFNVQAVDPLGRPDGNAEEKCINPAQGNYFYGCSVAPGARAARGVWALGLLGLAALGRRRARRVRCC